MKFILFQLDERHPGLPAIVGSISGIGSWLISHSPAIATVAGAIGATATATIAVLSLARMIYRLLADLRRRLRNREQRRRHFRDEPFEDHLP